MNIVAFRTLRAFYEKHKDCEQQLKTWYKEATRANWKSPEDVKAIFASASIIADNRMVFNIKGNKYRLIVKFNYKYGWAWIRFIGTHAKYDSINAKTI
jgi:mRNA interferase HigB